MTFTSPIRVPYRYTYKFGTWTFYGIKHKGLDYAAPVGTPQPWRPSIFPCLPGVVTRSAWSLSYGNVVYIRSVVPEGVVELRYAHMHQRYAEKESIVNKDTLLGIVGTTGLSTGNHLHLEGYLNGQLIDPLIYLTNKPMWQQIKDRLFGEKHPNDVRPVLVKGGVDDGKKGLLYPDGTLRVSQNEKGDYQVLLGALSHTVTSEEWAELATNEGKPLQ